jgi:hypothetical protein
MFHCTPVVRCRIIAFSRLAMDIRDIMCLKTCAAPGTLPRPPPDVHCTNASACYFPNTTYTSGTGVFLFDIEADPYENSNLAASQPDTVKSLMARLEFFVNKSIPQVCG